jgi:glycine/D-amino acid oxidase-like deaminating enzyme
MSAYRIHGLGLAGCTVAWHLWQRGATFSIVDDGQRGSSHVAAGIVQPVTGKNAAVSWEYDRFFAQADSFYRQIEAKLQTSFWHPLESIRLISPADEKKILPKLTHGPASTYVIGELEDHPWPAMRAIRLRGAARLDVAAFVDATKQFFASHRYSENPQDAENLYCLGAKGLISHHPRLWPHRCAKGEILTVHAPTWQQTRLISAGAWLVPIGNDCYKIGATYEWDHLDQDPTPAGRTWLESAATRLGGTAFSVVGHHAGIRPIVRKSQPIIGRESQSQSIVFNGLGSKGALYAPACARSLVAHLLDGEPLDPALSAAHYFASATIS